jgi:hypothetical protein
MSHLFLAFLQVALLSGLSLGLAAGCSKKDAPAPGSRKVVPGPAPEENPDAGLRKVPRTDPEEKPETPLTSEDPEVAAYFKKKGWNSYRSGRIDRFLRISDGKWMVLFVVNSEKYGQDVTLTADDFKMIAKSKTVQVLNLDHVKNTSDDSLKVIAGIPQLQSITIRSEEVTDAGIKALAQCKSLESVTLLSTKKVTDAGIKELAALPKLRSLDLFMITMNGSAFGAFAEAKALESLILDTVEGINDQGAGHIAKIPNLNELKIISGFGEQKLTASGIKAIVDQRIPARFEFHPALIDQDLLEALVAKGSNATFLNLQKTDVTDEMLKKLAGFKKLNYLLLDHTKVTAAGLEAISALPLHHLSMEGCELSEECFKAYGKMASLEKLSLPKTKMKAAWLQHIAKLPNLKDMNLDAADFDDTAVKYVATMPSLDYLTVKDTKLGDKGLAELVALPKLRSLLVDGTKVSKRVYQKAKKDHPLLWLSCNQHDR